MIDFFFKAERKLLRILSFSYYTSGLFDLSKYLIQINAITIWSKSKQVLHGVLANRNL